MGNFERETETTIYFLGGELGNFYPCPVHIFGHNFKNSESAYMYAKAMYFQDYDAMAKLKEITSAKEAKKIGRKVKNFNQNEWNQISYDYMQDVVYAKFSQNPILKQFLLDTNDKLIIECNGRDFIWSIGLYASDDRVLDQSQWNGKNWLGEILMNVREKLKIIPDYYEETDLF